MKNNENKELKCDIITGTYNRPKMLQRAIKSALNQTSPNWEHWIYDDGSDYDVRALVKKFGDERIHFMQGPKLTETQREQTSPCGRPRNPLLIVSSNEIIAYLDDDNYLWPEAIKTVLKYFAQYPDRDVVYTRLTYSGEGRSDKLPKEKREFRMFKYGLLDTGQMVHRRKCLDWTIKKWGTPWPLEEVIGEDQDFRRGLMEKFRLYPLDICFINKCIHPFMFGRLYQRQEKRGKQRE